MSAYERFLDQDIALNLMADCLQETNSRTLCEIPQKVLSFLGIYGSQRYAVDFLQNQVYEYDSTTGRFLNDPSTELFLPFVEFLVSVKQLSLTNEVMYGDEIHLRARYRL